MVTVLVGYFLTEPAKTPVAEAAGKREFRESGKRALTAPPTLRTFRLPFVAGWSSPAVAGLVRL
jgi:hypothetical protein